MKYRRLGRTGISVSSIAFGAGPVSGLMTGPDARAHLETVRTAIEIGINWFDTAAGYGEGLSEMNLGRVLTEFGAKNIHVATKVRIPEKAFDRIGEYVRESVSGSLERLSLPRVTLLQLHNGITRERGREPASITPQDILGPVADAFRGLRKEGLALHLGLTGTGEPEAIREVIRSGVFDTLQVPFNILNPSAGSLESVNAEDVNFGNIIADCMATDMGVFAIRVFAGGAILGMPPSAHTLKTPFFPLSLYERDMRRAQLLNHEARDHLSPAERAVRFVLSHEGVSSAIIGFGSARHINEIATIKLDRLV